MPGSVKARSSKTRPLHHWPLHQSMGRDSYGSKAKGESRHPAQGRLEKMGRTEGKLRHRCSISLKGWTGRRKSLEKSMKVFKRLHSMAKISDPRSDQITRALQCCAQFRLHPRGHRETKVIFQWSNKIKKITPVVPEKMDWWMGQLRTGKQEHEDYSKRPDLTSSRIAFSEPMARPHCEMSFSDPRTPYIWHQNKLSKYALASTEKEAPYSIIYSLETAQNLPRTHLPSGKVKKRPIFAVVEAGRMSPSERLQDALVEMSARGQWGIRVSQSGERV